MNPIFAADTAAIFEGPLSVAAIYAPAAGAPYDVRVIPQVGDQNRSFGAGRFVSSAGVFLVPVASVAAPAEGDTITIDGIGNFTVQADPTRDERRLWWRIAASPA